MRQKRNLVGAKHDRLTVIREERDRGKEMLVVKCSCGTIKTIPRQHWGLVRSCGCLLSENGKATGTTNLSKVHADIRKYGTHLALISRTEPNKRNKSGYIGVWFNPKTQKYESYINVNHKKKHLGSYNNLPDAVRVRQEAFDTYYAPLIAAKNAELRMAVC